VLPDAFDDERIIHRLRAADYCRGHRRRVSDYPASLWVLMIGIIAVLSAGTPRASVRQPE
jgi:hypothetical protein